MVDIDANRLTPEYLAGLFAADGSVGIYDGRLVVTITQKSCPRLCQAIATKRGDGCAANGNYVARGKAGLLFLMEIATLIVGQKAEQVRLAIRYSSLPLHSTERAQIAQRLKQLKKQ